MNAKRLVELALKVWGVILLISALASLPVALLMAGADAGDEGQAAFARVLQNGSILHFVIQAVVGIAVLVWADRITDLIEADTTPLQIDTSTSELQKLGFGLVGLVILVYGLQDLAVTAYTWLSKPSFDERETWSYVWARQDEAIIRGLVQAAAGALLVFGRRAIADAWSRLRGRYGDDYWDEPESNEPLATQETSGGRPDAESR